MGFGRSCFIVSFPMLFTVATIVLAIITFLGCYKHAWALRTIYFMRLDFSDVNADGVSLSSLAKDAGIHAIYQIGANGYCYGSKGSGGSANIKGCETPMEPFWFDIVSFAADQSSALASVLKDVNLPSEITSYDGILKNASYTMWACWIVTMGLSFIQLLLGFFAFRSRGVSCFLSVVSVLSFLTSIVAAGIATGMYTIYRNKFNEYAGKFGVSASLGTTGIALAWVTAAICLLAGLFWVVSTCIGGTRHKHQRLPEYDDEKAFIGYVPQH